MEALKIEGLKAALAGRLVLEDVSFSVQEKTLAAIVGPNGAGKTTLLKLLLGLIKPLAGSIELSGQPLTNSEHRRLIGYLPQKAGFDRYFPVGVADVVRMGQGSWSFFSRAGAEERKRVAWCLEQVGLAAWEKRPIGELSGGQQQLVFLARAINGSPRLLLLDEPTAGLDVTAKKRFYELLSKLKISLGLTVVVVSHDLEAISVAADRIIFLGSKKVVAQGTPTELVQNSEIRKTYASFLAPVLRDLELSVVN